MASRVCLSSTVHQTSRLYARMCVVFVASGKKLLPRRIIQKLPLQKLPLQKLPLQKLPLQKLPLQKLPLPNKQSLVHLTFHKTR